MMAWKRSLHKILGCYWKTTLCFYSTIFYGRWIKYLSKTSYYKNNWKKDRDKRYIKNWRPISLSNVDVKLISKVLTSRLKSVISVIVNKNWVAYVNNRFISESGRPISDVLEITNSWDTEWLSMIVDIEEAFESINHSFLMRVLKNLDLTTKFENGYQF